MRNTLNKARSLMSTDPELAMQQLRLTLEKVRQAADLEPDVRDQFVDSLQSALREASVRKDEVEQHRQQRLESGAAASERLLAARRWTGTQMTVKELFERFNSLLAERNYAAADEICDERGRGRCPAIRPRSWRRWKRAWWATTRTSWQLRIDRQKGVVDTLFQVEKSQIPFPDDQPIVYPDAEWWQQMTVRRKDKYSSMDLAKKGSAEKRIDDALKSPTEVVFVEAPLQEVIDYLKDRHKIEIQIDNKALQDVGIGTDTPVTVDLKGISLRSALRLMLKELSLTYIIKDEVLQITTPEEADNQLSTKVYPVADLVLPIPQGGDGWHGRNDGRHGRRNGWAAWAAAWAAWMGMGGMGGGMMGGMGGGMFNVPRDLLPKIPPGGFQAFAVKDDLSVPAKTATGEHASSRAVPATIGNASGEERQSAGEDRSRDRRGGQAGSRLGPVFLAERSATEGCPRRRSSLDEPTEVRPRHCPDRRGLAASPEPAVDVRGPCPGDGGRRPAEGGHRASDHVGGRFCRYHDRPDVHRGLPFPDGAGRAGVAGLPSGRQPRSASAPSRICSACRRLGIPIISKD